MRAGSCEIGHAETVLPTGGALLFLDLLSYRLASQARPWIGAMNALIHPRTRPRDEFLALYAATALKLGRAPIGLKPLERDLLKRARIDWPLDGWTVDELGRVVLLLIAGAYLMPDELCALVRDGWDGGDGGGREAVLRALPLLPQPDRFVTLAVDACRTEGAPIFAALATDNPFPARHFSDEDFHELALKSARLELPLGRVIGLSARWSETLGRQAADFVRERTAAGRHVPDDIDLLLSGRSP